MTTGNAFSEPPCGPTSNPAESKTGDASVDRPETTTGDDVISVSLTTSIERPEPDPMLGEGRLPDVAFSASPMDALASSVPTREASAEGRFSGLTNTGDSGDDLKIDIQMTPSPDLVSKTSPKRRFSRDAVIDEGRDQAKPVYSWSTVILGSYASAVTLALIWVLATGKSLPRSVVRVSEHGSSAQQKRRDAEFNPPALSPAAGAIPSNRLTTLGKPLVIGDLEVTPLVILHKTVQTSRYIGPENQSRDNPDCLALTVRLKNTSSDRQLTPLDPSSVRDVEKFGESSYIETGSGQKFSMFQLALESEWSIDEQSFPTIPPGAVEDVVLVSEPVQSNRLIGPLVWRITMRTGGPDPELFGVRFSRQDVSEAGD